MLEPSLKLGTDLWRMMVHGMPKYDGEWGNFSAVMLPDGTQASEVWGYGDMQVSEAFTLTMLIRVMMYHDCVCVYKRALHTCTVETIVFVRQPLSFYPEAEVHTVVHKSALLLPRR